MDTVKKKVINESLRGFGNDQAKIACKVQYRPIDSKYDEKIRKFQGCPTIAISKGGRIFLAWYSGGTGEPHMANYNYLVYSDDGGKNFGAPLLVIESEKERNVHALDIQLWTAPNGSLWVFWVQNNAMPLTEDNKYMLSARETSGLPVVNIDGYLFPDMRHTLWCVVCDNPDAKDPVFTEPRLLDIGFLRCKPLVTDSGRWIFFNYDQLTDTYGYSISDDNGKTFSRHYGTEKIPTSFDEVMAYQKRNGAIHMFARNRSGELAEAISLDDGIRWSKALLNGISSPNTRFYISRTPSGKIILVNNDMTNVRCRMSVWLSDDDGETFAYKKLVDDPDYVMSYPDVDFFDNKIYLTYDRERTGAKEIRLLVFTENDLMQPCAELHSQIVSKPITD